MPAEWKRCLLGDVLTLQRGFDITKKEQKQGTVPVISSSGINSYHNVAKVKGPGVIIGRKGSLGTTFYVKEDYWPHDTTLWVKDFHGNSPKFTYYFLGTLNLANFDVGAANPSLNRNHVHLLPVYWPPVFIQHTIADILSAYDDLIENNTRRIAILEEMARALYHEWFVKFRFPGHENVKMVESELGMIPEGWEVVRFFDIVDVLSGGTPKTTVSDYWNGDIPFYTPKDAPDSFFVTATEKSITEAGLKTCNSKLYPKNTVFITARGTVGKIALNAIDMAMNQSCYALRGRDGINQLFVFMHIHNCIRQLKKTATGAVFDTIIVDTFKQLKVVKPPSALIEAFARTASPIFDQILNLTQRNTDLRRARDLLLPRLISGEIDVSGWAGGVRYEEMAESLAGGPGARRVAEARPDVGAITPIDKDALQWRSLWDEE
jgi:type I restriction enzyme S subunit